ncbi:growth-regulating factor 1-like [Lycium barbarum]|uniref:growth-regulating factor 1-like n=1 Tax=Lycium barbarum TaxID=112863 RepID=UPI00293E356A|nr:growth-regulating factor 1-like [Lycium barbarum]
MDFGVMDSGGGVNICSDNTSYMFVETKQKLYGSSGFHKHERSEDEWNKDTKLARTTSPNLLMRSNDSHQMLSFSTPNSQNVTMPYYYQHPSNAFGRNSAGCGSGALNAGNMHGLIAGVKGPFTPSQWMELEHQALIYKYIVANVPIPPYLLNPIRKALESAGFSTFAGLRPNVLGWGGFHLGFSHSNDPEPGRCRRTDGKKWRCSRDAVADQKYCERHMNRGRHRSRKPVEGQTANSASGATTSAKPMSSSASAALASGSAAASNSLSHHNQLCNLQPAATNPSSTSTYLERSYTAKGNFGERYSDTKGPIIVSPSVKESQYSIQKEQNLYGVTSSFGLVCADSLINPLNKISSIVNCRSYGNSDDISDQEKNKSQHHPLRQFMDDWPKNQSDQSNVSWPGIDLQSDPTQLSISIPVVNTSDFMSSTSSPTNDKLTASPHGPTREHEATQMGLGIGTRSWIPISWESSMGGPLGEVLHSSSSGDCKNKSSALNLMTYGWDRSPTGVLQKNSFRSLSNSSAGSSPRAENSKTTNEGSSLCNGLLGTTLMNPTLPAM